MKGLFVEGYLMGNGEVLPRWFRIVYRSCCALFLVGMVVLLPARVFAADFSVTPAVIDGKGKVREILKYTVVLENTTSRLLSIYPWVSDVDVLTGKTGLSDLNGGAPADKRDTSLSRWIEVTRGVIDLLPGEKKDVPVLIQIHPSAPVGHYHAFLRFSPGVNRAAAEANLEDTMQVAVNIEVLDDARERLAIGLFAPIQKFFGGGKATFNYRVENIGNRGIIPGGKILIYDGDGREVAELPANKDGKRLEPSEKTELAAVWASGGAFGRYKAKLQIEYGDRGVAEDTIFFWVLPWHKLLGMFGAIIVASVLVALFLHSRSVAGRAMVYREAHAELHRHPQFGHDHATPRAPIRPRKAKTYSDENSDETNVSRLTQKMMFWRRRRGTVNELIEVAIPPPTHTTMRRVASASTIEGGTRLGLRARSPVLEAHQVRLTAKPKPPIDPVHVVKLRK